MPAIRGDKSKKKTRRHTRDLDQIHADLHDQKHLAQHTESKAPEDLPGLGQWYCKECAKWFESETNFAAHYKGKVHKRRYDVFPMDVFLICTCGIGSLTSAQSEAASRRTVFTERGRGRRGPENR
ncbi:hypothetical protein DM02DRAFT_608803 [Periconia macrospinosa]|uniref:C2H2-type domain-containing protein n=1 Tax=Periconia macrospinosa TaxID=97972 RepID=A0A2V1EEK2_9PLEO|nr:hypothetical protein DM02DRAFT_608803 [Periconia macrospinosa]